MTKIEELKKKKAAAWDEYENTHCWVMDDQERSQARNARFLAIALDEEIRGLEMELHIEKIARVCHQTNKAYCESLDDMSQVDWEEAPEWQKESARNGVRFHLNTISTPEGSHKNWMEVKEADGWIYGEVKDVDKKTHPCFLPYEKLPDDQKIKDYIFRSVIEHMDMGK